MILDQPLSRNIKTTKSHLKMLESVGVITVKDLLLYFPRTYEDKRKFTDVVNIRTDEVNNLKGRLTNIFHKRARSGKALSRAVFTDKTGSIEVIWFNQPFLQRILKNNQQIILSGKAKYNFNKISLQNPAYEEVKPDLTHTGRIVPVYHQTEGLSSKWIREKLKPLIKEWISALEEYMPQSILDKYSLIGYKSAIYEAHFPTDEKKLDAAKQRLSFDELFLIQLKALQKKWMWQNSKHFEQKNISIPEELKELVAGLPFDLTDAQKRCLDEILTDIQKPYPMSRLLQGDVGSGKTIVAGLAIFTILKSGFQAALMAPTEILARQHYSTLFSLLQKFGFNIQFLSGSTTESQKNEILKQLSSGTVDLIIGTHSLIQEGVSFKNLGLAVIDEQHRFGVKQREILKSSGTPHLLNLTATPIPRTLAMTLYGDQDLSIIDELPKGRREIITRIVPENKRMDAYRWIEDQVKKGRQAFVICPLIDESDVLEIKSAIQEYEKLQNEIFKDLKVGLLHGKMKAQEKEQIMNEFKQNNINILVSTSVIEVGIDVPNASIMMIEGADRFGLSQLHQFRGRVGRGEHQSYCFLFPKANSADSNTRLKAMTVYSSGFKLAEIDLEIRGPGEIFGLRQSGIPDLKMASLMDSETLTKAREAAQLIISENPDLNNYPSLMEKLAELTEIYIKD